MKILAMLKAEENESAATGTSTSVDQSLVAEETMDATATAVDKEG